MQKNRIVVWQGLERLPIDIEQQRLAIPEQRGTVERAEGRPQLAGAGLKAQQP